MPSTVSGKIDLNAQIMFCSCPTGTAGRPHLLHCANNPGYVFGFSYPVERSDRVSFENPLIRQREKVVLDNLRKISKLLDEFEGDFSFVGSELWDALWASLDNLDATPDGKHYARWMKDKEGWERK